MRKLHSALLASVFAIVALSGCGRANPFALPAHAGLPDDQLASQIVNSPAGKNLIALGYDPHDAYAKSKGDVPLVTWLPCGSYSPRECDEHYKLLASRNPLPQTKGNRLAYLIGGLQSDMSLTIRMPNTCGSTQDWCDLGALTSAQTKMWLRAMVDAALEQAKPFYDGGYEYDLTLPDPNGDVDITATAIWANPQPLSGV